MEKLPVVKFEVKPWESETDLAKLAKTIKGQTFEGVGEITWSEKFTLEEVGFGIKKLVLSARVSEEGCGEAIADMISELFEDEVQSVDIEEGKGEEVWGDYKEFGFLEPMKRYQNSFSLFQKRGGDGWSEPSYSWSP